MDWSDLGNDELTYEKKHELNLGFDAGFFNNRINFANKFDSEMALTHNLYVNIDEFANMGPFINKRKLRLIVISF